jgi:hypothetical protein
MSSSARNLDLNNKNSELLTLAKLKLNQINTRHQKPNNEVIKARKIYYEYR